MSQDPVSEPTEGTGSYLEIEASSKGKAIKKLRAGPNPDKHSNDIWKFVRF